MGVRMTVESKAVALREHLSALADMSFGDFSRELDLLDYLLGNKCSYVYSPEDSEALK